MSHPPHPPHPPMPWSWRRSALFFSEQFTSCNQCHQLSRSQMDRGQTFTDHRYHNIGVPENTALRPANSVAVGTVGPGLAGNPLADAPEERGIFRTPTLRKVAVTGPYMQRGDLRTVVSFYNRSNSRAAAARLTPETGEPCEFPPVPQNLGGQGTDARPSAGRQARGCAGGHSLDPDRRPLREAAREVKFFLHRETRSWFR